MRLFAWLALVIVALAAHEYLVPVGDHRKLSIRMFRYFMLAIALVGAASAGPAIVGRFADVSPALNATATGLFVAAGDPALTDALARQQPESPFPSGESSASADAWRRRIIDALRNETGIVADPPSAVPSKVLSSEMVGDVRRSFGMFDSWDGTGIPVYIHEPSGGGFSKAAVLVLPGHGDGIVATAGLVDDYQHAAALSLARRGYVTLTPELRGFGFLGAEGGANHRVVSAAALEAGTSYKAVVLRDLVRALSVLATWPGVDPQRLAVAGTSLGGEMAVLLGALDERVRVVVSSSYGGTVGPVTLEENLTDDAGQTPHGCHTIPGVNRILYQEDWARLVAPRALLMVRGDRNSPQSKDAFGKAVKEAYAAHSVLDRFLFSIEPGAHEFYLEPSVSFLGRWL